LAGTSSEVIFLKGILFILFFMGYLYASVFIASVFGAAGWPLATTMISFSPVWAIGQIILVIVLTQLA